MVNKWKIAFWVLFAVTIVIFITWYGADQLYERQREITWELCEMYNIQTEVTNILGEHIMELWAEYDYNETLEPFEQINCEELI